MAKAERKTAADLLAIGAGQRRFVLLESLLALAKRKAFILRCVCASTLIALLVVLLLPDTYTANAKALWSVHNHSSLLGFADRLNLLQVAEPHGGELSAAMLRSETVANHLIDRFSLMKVYGADLRVDARHILSDRTTISLGEDGTISISVDDHNPQRAADLTNAYLEELQTLAKTLAKLQAGKQGDFLAKQAKAASEEFVNAQQAFKETEEETGLVVLAPQITVLIQQEADTRARVAAQEVRVQWLRSFAAPENPELVRAVEQLSALRDQETRLVIDKGGRPDINMPLEKMPVATMEYMRSFRELMFKEAFFNMLRRQLDAARFDETKADLIIHPVVQILDTAVPPERKSAPNRFLIVSAVALSALLLVVLAVFLMEKVKRAQPQPKSPARVQLYSYQLEQQLENTRKAG